MLKSLAIESLAIESLEIESLEIESLMDGSAGKTGKKAWGRWHPEKKTWQEAEKQERKEREQDAAAKVNNRSESECLYITRVVKTTV